MNLRKLALQCLSSMFIILACGKATLAQQPYPRYGFLEVTSEAGAPVAGAAVVIYNGFGEEIHRQTTDSEGKLVLRQGMERITLEQQKSLKNGANCVIRVIKSGYLTHEEAIEGDLTGAGAFGPDLNQESGAAGFKIKIRLLPQPKSKVSDVRKKPPGSQTQNRPP